MRETSTFVKIDRNILQWRWFQDANTLQVFLYLILRANIEDKEVRDHVVHRGELEISLARIAEETGLSTRSVRTALQHLERSQEIHKKTTKTKSTNIYYIEGFERYQGQATKDRQRDDKEATKDRQRTDKEYKKEKNNKNIKNAKNSESARAREEEDPDFLRPTAEEVAAFCKENNLNVDAQRFVDYYSSNGWTVGGAPMHDWKATARNWSRREKPAPATKPETPKVHSFDSEEFFITSLMAGGLTEEEARDTIARQRRST